MALPLPAIYAGGKLLVDNWDTVTIAVDKLMQLAKKGDAAGQKAQLTQIRADAEKAKAESVALLEEIGRLRASMAMQTRITLASVLSALAAATTTILLLIR